MTSAIPREKQEKRAKRVFFALLEYLVVTLLLFGIIAAYYRDALTDIHRHVIGSGEIFYWVWREWHAENLLKTLFSADTDLFRFLYYGIFTINARPECGNAADILLFSIPLRVLFGFPAAWNIKIIIILLFNGLAAYFVIKRMSGSGPISFVCALFMTLNPVSFQIINLARQRDMIFGFFILFFYFLIESCRSLQLKTTIQAAVFLGLTTVFYWFYGLFGIMITLGVFLYKLIIFAKAKDSSGLKMLTKRFLLGILIVAVMALPFSLWYFMGSGEFRVSMLSDVKFFQPFPHLEEIITPSPQKLSADGFPLESARNILRASLPLKWYPFSLLFVIPGIFAFYRRPRLFIMLLFIALFFYAYAFGPYLQTDFNCSDGSFLRINGSPIKMPWYYMFRYVPVSGRLHRPWESLMAVSIAFTIMTGLGLTHLIELARKNPRRKILMPAFYVFLALIAFMVVKTPYGYSNEWGMLTGREIKRMEVPDFFWNLAKREDTGIIHLPVNSRMYDNHIFYVTFHNQKISIPFVNRGSLIQLGFLPDNRFVRANSPDEFLNGNPVMISFAEFEKGEIDSIDISAVEELKESGFKIILLHEYQCLGIPGAPQDFYHNYKQALNHAFGPPIEKFSEKCSPLMSIPPSRTMDPSQEFFEVSVFKL